MATNEELAAAIRAAAPDAVEPFLVYGDWLQAQGDPRGELIAIQAKLLDAPKDRALRDREIAHLTDHDDALIGELPVDNGLTFEYRLGFFRSARISASDDLEVAEVFRQLRAQPAASFLRSLTIGAAVYGEENRYDALWEAVDELGLPETLTELVVGDFTNEDSELSWSHMGDVSPLWRHAGKLERLKLRCGSFELGAMAAPSLRSFEIETGGLRKGNLQSILAARWPALESLEVYFGNPDYDADCAVDDLWPLLDGTAAPAGLVALGLVNCDFADDLAGAVASSALLPRLQALSLAKGTMAERGAQAILSSKKAFAHLRLLDLSENFIPKELVGELGSVCRQVIADQRWDEDPDYRYVVVGE